jgi:hypothetical protein
LAYVRFQEAVSVTVNGLDRDIMRDADMVWLYPYNGAELLMSLVDI